MTDSTTPKRPKDLDVLSISAPCPSCGGYVDFASLSSVLSVCQYCQTNVVRDGEKFKSHGKQSLILEDYSPLQLGSRGEYDKHDFTLIGRVQYEYSDGTWNEWRIQFTGRETGWLTEALGDYSITLDASASNFPPYHDLSINDKVHFDGHNYTLTDKRTATVTGCEGELPRISLNGEVIHRIDARYQRWFITLDYAENGADKSPLVFQGIATSLEKLVMQGLKDEEQRDDTNLSETGDIDKLDCPNCGYPVPYVSGATNCLVCPSCRSEIELSGEQAEVITMHSMMQRISTTLQLGDSARIIESEIGSVCTTCLNDYKQPAPSNKHHDFTIIGIQRLYEVGEYSSWTEYLLYSKTDGFLWLSEESDGWKAARVLNELPNKSGGNVKFRNQTWRRLDVYRNKVSFASGAFNWRVKLNDSMKLTDYSHGNEIITSEQDASEITYTLAMQISVLRVGLWFDKDLSQKSYSARQEDHEQSGINVVEMLFWIIVSIVFVGLMNGGGCSSAGFYSSSGRSGFSTSGSHK